MFFEFKNIVLKLEMKKHYENETEDSKILNISIKIEVNDQFLNAKQLQDTFDYADYEIKLLDIFEGKKFELIEEVASLIFDFTERYSTAILVCNLTISKKNVLVKASEISMSASRQFRRVV